MGRNEKDLEEKDLEVIISKEEKEQAAKEQSKKQAVNVNVKEQTRNEIDSDDYMSRFMTIGIVGDTRSISSRHGTDFLANHTLL